MNSINKDELIFPSTSLHEKVTSFMTTKLMEDNKSILDQNNLVDKKHFKNLINKPIIWMQQEHGKNALKVDSKHLDRMVLADAIFTHQKGLVLAVLSADCLPIILSSNDGLEIAAIHAGWRGLSKGIIESTLDLFSCPLNNISAWLAPCISKKNFEVGSDVFKSFNNKKVHESFSLSSSTGKWNLDLHKAASKLLNNYDVKILQSNLCTYAEDDLLYSYRRDKTKKRMVTVIWRD